MKDTQIPEAIADIGRAMFRYEKGIENLTFKLSWEGVFSVERGKDREVIGKVIQKDYKSPQFNQTLRVNEFYDLNGENIGKDFLNKNDIHYSLSEKLEDVYNQKVFAVPNETDSRTNKLNSLDNIV
jgi:hypothetical protein